MSTATLPEKLSDLLELALADLEKAEADPMCRVNMLAWLAAAETDGKCLLCLAGELAIERHSGIPPRGVPSFVRVADYHKDPAQFKADMRGVVKLLREHGL